MNENRSEEQEIKFKEIKPQVQRGIFSIRIISYNSIQHIIQAR